jgi:hypothetical protein
LIQCLFPIKRKLIIYIYIKPCSQCTKFELYVYGNVNWNKCYRMPSVSLLLLHNWIPNFQAILWTIKKILLSTRRWHCTPHWSIKGGCCEEIIPHLEGSWVLEHFVWNNETHIINFLENNFTFVILGKDMHTK